jgi:hypothetical protein
MAGGELFKAALHIEVQLKIASDSHQLSEEICSSVKTKIIEDYLALQVGQKIYSFGWLFSRTCRAYADQRRWNEA